MTTARSEVTRLLADENDFLVASHVSPDGDALGSTAAVGWLLERLGKKYTLYNASGLPEHLAWLPLPAPLVSELPSPLPRWTIVLDSGDLPRAGEALAAAAADTLLVDIDHHLGNPLFGEINWVDTRFSSVGEMIGRVALELGQPLTDGLGEAVYVALVTDTGGFAYDNTTPETMELAAEIIRQGLKPGAVNAMIRNQWTLPRLKLMSEVLGRIELVEDGRIGVAAVTRDMFERTGAGKGDTDGVVESIRRIRGVQVAVSLREDAPDSFKFSLRSTGDVNVQQVAASLGGGGHKNAAGGQVEAPLAQAKAVLVERLKAVLAGRPA